MVPGAKLPQNEEKQGKQNPNKKQKFSKILKLGANFSTPTLQVHHVPLL